MRSVVLILPALTLLVPFPAQGAGALAHVHIQDFAYNPSPVRIEIGDTVEWDNHDFVAHTATDHGEAFHSGRLENAEGFSHFFGEPETYHYYCTLHPEDMRGDVYVNQPGAVADLRIESIRAPDVAPGVLKRLNVTLENVGAMESPASAVRFEYEYEGVRHLIGTVETSMIGPRDERWILLDWIVAGKVGDFALIVTADAEGSVAESDEANNVTLGVATILLSMPPKDVTDL